MKKVALSALAAAMISGVASADALTLYSDPKTGQVYTTPGEGRVEMGDFVDAKTVDMSDREIESGFAEYKDAMKKYTNVTSKAKKIEFSGTHYLGYTSANPETTTSVTGGDQAKYSDSSAGFEMRRNYVQVKAYFNDKDYVRVTMDATKELASSETASTTTTLKESTTTGDLNGDGDTTDTFTSSSSTTVPRNGYANVFVKYAYLYLDEILPYTGVEAGIAHRPWIDYEEHNGWYYRSFNKVVIEEKGTATETGVDLVNSADFGVNFKTKTEDFSSEIGIFNGEGYHADKAAANQKYSGDMSLEWRLTGHLIGSGTKVSKNDRVKDTYAHISTFGLMSKNHKDDSATLDQTSTSALKGEYDRNFYGIHAVYNQPEFLIAAQYVTAEDKGQDQATAANWGKREYDVFSVNAEIRPMTDWTLIGRYDDYKIDDTKVDGTAMSSSVEGTKIIAGLAYKYNKNVSFIGSAKWANEEYTVANGTYAAGSDTGESKTVYQLTTEVKW